MGKYAGDKGAVISMAAHLAGSSQRRAASEPCAMAPSRTKRRRQRSVQNENQPLTLEAVARSLAAPRTPREQAVIADAAW